MPERRWATISRQRRAYEKIRPAPEPSRGISSPFRNAAKFVIKISKSDTLSFKYVFVLFLQKARPQVPQILAPTPDFQGGAIFFPTVPNDPCRRRRDLAGTSRRTGSKRSNKLCGRFRHIPRVSNFAPRRAADADLAMFKREGRRKSGDCGRSAASAGETAACRRQGTRLQTAQTAALWRGRPTAAENTAEAALPALDAADSPRSDKKKPAESRASGGRTCRAKKISAASWRC